MMDTKTKRLYSEVYAMLQALGEEYIKRLPTQLYHLIENSKDGSYMPVYHIETLENETNIMRESLAMIALFHLNYWCESEEEKKELEQLLEENEKKNKETLKENYDLQMVLGKEKNSTSKTTLVNRENETNDLNNTEEKSLAKKENFLTRIIKKLFHKS